MAYCKAESGNCFLNKTHKTCALTLKKMMQDLVVVVTATDH